MAELMKVENAAIVEVRNFGDTAIEQFLASRSISENSVKTYRNALRRLFNFFAENEVTMPTEETVNAFLDDLRGKGKSVSTIRLYITVAKSFFAWTGRKNLYPNVAADVKAKLRKSATHNKKALTLEQAQNLLGAVKGDDVISLRNKAIIALCLQCGLRTVEISRADVADLQPSIGYYTLKVQGKGHQDKDQVVKVSAPVAEMIFSYLDTRGAVADDEPLFTSTSRNNSKYGNRLSAQSVGKMIKATMKSVSINDRQITAHSTRHFAATTAIKAGVDLREVSSMLRHSNINVTMTYLHDIDLESRRAELAVSDSLFSGAAS